MLQEMKTVGTDLFPLTQSRGTRKVNIAQLVSQCVHQRRFHYFDHLKCMLCGHNLCQLNSGTSLHPHNQNRLTLISSPFGVRAFSKNGIAERNTCDSRIRLSNCLVVTGVESASAWPARRCKKKSFNTAEASLLSSGRTYFLA